MGRRTHKQQRKASTPLDVEKERAMFAKLFQAVRPAEGKRAEEEPSPQPAAERPHEASRPMPEAQHAEGTGGVVERRPVQAHETHPTVASEARLAAMISARASAVDAKAAELVAVLEGLYRTAEQLVGVCAGNLQTMERLDARMKELVRQSAAAGQRRGNGDLP